MHRYRFTFIAAVCLLLGTVALWYKAGRKTERTDILIEGLQPLKEKLAGTAQLRCFLADKSLTEALIRGRFALTPLVLHPVQTFNPGDTVLMITKPNQIIAENELLWSYVDTAVRFTLVRISN